MNPATRVPTVTYARQAELSHLPEANVLSQPASRGTAIAILHGLVQIHLRDRSPRIVVMPSRDSKRCSCRKLANRPWRDSSTNRRDRSKSVMREVMRQRIPKCWAFQVPDSPGPIRPEVTPATATSCEKRPIITTLLSGPRGRSQATSTDRCPKSTATSLTALTHPSAGI